MTSIVFQVILLAPFLPLKNVPAELHWHFYEYGHFGPAAKKQARRAMKDSGAVEDPCGNIYLSRFDGKADTLFKLYPKLDGAVHVTTSNQGEIFDATLAVSKNEPKARIYALVVKLVSVLKRGSQ